MSKIEVNQVSSQCGSTLTIGQSGDTVQLATGASQTGFGRTGAVDWQTGSIKTASFTAANGEGYFVNTTSGEITVTLPSASAGDIIAVQDYNNTFDSNTCIIQAPSGVKINGGTAAGTIDLTTEGQGLTLVYVDSTVGWRSVESTTFSDTSLIPAYITATGGTITTCGDYKIHTFTSPGTFCVSAGSGPLAEAEYIVVAGGGGGGGGYGGGGGAGGFRFSSPSLAPVTYPGKPLAAPAGIIMTTGAFPVTVGSGGTGSTGSNTAQDGTRGSNSSFAGTTTITSAGGGAGAMVNPSDFRNGGSGGGGSVSGPGTPQVCAGTGNTPPVTPAQGTDGGDGFCGGCYGQGGGGGAIVAGSTGSGPVGGAGGDGAGIPTAFGSNGESCGSFRYYAGGGGGGRYGPGGGGGGGGSGGKGGGGDAGCNPAPAGTANTGGGGGGANGRQPCNHDGGNGGSGIVIIRYRFQE